MEENVGRKWDESPGDVGARDRQRAGYGAFRIGFFEAELEPHHEVDPVARLLSQSLDDGPRLLFSQAVSLEDFGDFAHLFVWNLGDFAFLALAFFGVVFGVALGGHVAAEAHRDRSGGDLRQTRGYDDSGLIDRPAQTRGKCERHRQTISHSDYDVANDFTRREVTFDVGRLGH